MKKKKQLKNDRNKDRFEHVYIDEDLTALRRKMLRELKQDRAVKRAWTIDGKIHCVLEENGKEVKKTIDSPDDLLRVGWSEDKVHELGLYIEL